MSNALVQFPHQYDPRNAGIADPAEMYITGSLPPGSASAAYEGTLQVVNSEGACTIELIEGNLPPGYSLTINQDTKEILLTWPDYREEVVPIVNASFEAGDVGWYKGRGWYIGSGAAYDGAKAGIFKNYTGIASITSSTRAPVTPGQRINASCQIQQGASSEGNASARILLEWYRADGTAVPGGEGHSYTGGTLVNSGSNGEWKRSSVSAFPPTAAAFAAVACSANRERQNRELRVDAFEWDATQPSVGTTSTDDVCLTIVVRDATGRSAGYSGCIHMAASTTKWVWVEELTSTGRTIRGSESYLGPWTTLTLSAPGAPGSAGSNGAWVSKVAPLYIMHLFNGSQAIISSDTDFTDGTITGVYKSLGQSNYPSFHERVVNGQHVLYCVGGRDSGTRLLISLDGGLTWSSAYSPAHTNGSASWMFYTPPHLLSNGKWVCYGESGFAPTGGGKVCVCSDLIPGPSSVWSFTNIANVTGGYFFNNGHASGCDGTTYYVIGMLTPNIRMYSYSSSGAQSYQTLSTSGIYSVAGSAGGYYLGDGIIVVPSSESKAWITYNRGASWVLRSFGGDFRYLNRVGPVWVTGGSETSPRISTDNGVTWAALAGVPNNAVAYEQGVFPVLSGSISAGLWD